MDFFFFSFFLPIAIPSLAIVEYIVRSFRSNDEFQAIRTIFIYA